MFHLSRLGTVSWLGAISLLVAAVPMAPSVAATGNSTTIVYAANPPNVFAFKGLPTALATMTPSYCEMTYGLACYTPQEIRSAYNVPSSILGDGQTIVIIDAYGSPTLQNDLATFDAAFGLPAPTLNVFYPVGKPTYNPRQDGGNEIGWAEETSLDVEWAHAIAPDATIDLVVAPTNAGNALNDAEKFAVSNHLGNVMSMSFGAPEAAIAGGGNNLQVQQAEAIFAEAAGQKMSVFASSGDSGAANGYPTTNPLFPASSPYVTSVGGTNLFMNDNGKYKGETVWNDADPSLCPFGCDYGPFGATGGAPSSVFSSPTYQAGITGFTERTTSDVSYNASVYTAILAYISMPGVQPGFYFFGGTSEGSPQWAAIAALADEANGTPLGQLNPLLYAIASNPTEYAAAFHDVSIGNNAFFGPGYSASTGYDLPTGLGSPDVANLISILSTH